MGRAVSAAGKWWVCGVVKVASSGGRMGGPAREVGWWVSRQGGESSGQVSGVVKSVGVWARLRAAVDYCVQFRMLGL